MTLALEFTEKDVRILREQYVSYTNLDRFKISCTYDCDFATKVVLDLARLDRIGGILGDHLVQIYGWSTNHPLPRWSNTHV